MSAIASPEFISLCRAQLRLLTQQLSDSSSALYIVDVSDAGPDRAPSNYVPLVSYPEPVDSWVGNFTKATNWSEAAMPNPLALPGAPEAVIEIGPPEPADGEQPTEATSRREPPEPAFENTPYADAPYADAPYTDTPYSPEPSFSWPDSLRPDQQLVVPLVYTDMVVGLLISVRRDRAWHSEEQQHIEAVAQSLAAGCVLERRNQWLQSQLAHKRGLQSRQSEIFHNLLHQFRNPLTAVSTFGQLMVKRLEPEDPNQPIATGIVRESKRLRELVTHFDEAVAIGDADLAAEVSSVPLLPAAQALLSPAKEPAALGSGLGHPLTLCAQYLPDIVEPILAVANIVAAEKGVDLQSQVASDTSLIWGEEEALGEVISNLIDNAIKYSPAGARVWVQTGVSRMGDSQSNQPAKHYQGIVVADTGPGISTTDQARLFERNYRGVQAQSDIPGTGLGLAIAQSLAQEMQGSIEVISPAVGTPWLPTQPSNQASTQPSTQGPGTVFIVWLLEVDRRA
ncbi:MAG: ATP-binding protein [Cyanobacteria bacterium J06598_3]